MDYEWTTEKEKADSLRRNKEENEAQKQSVKDREKEGLNPVAEKPKKTIAEKVKAATKGKKK